MSVKRLMSSPAVMLATLRSLKHMGESAIFFFYIYTLSSPLPLIPGHWKNGAVSCQLTERKILTNMYFFLYLATVLVSLQLNYIYRNSNIPFSNAIMVCMSSLFPSSIHLSMTSESWGQLQPISAVRGQRKALWTSYQKVTTRDKNLFFLIIQKL